MSEEALARRAGAKQRLAVWSRRLRDHLGSRNSWRKVRHFGLGRLLGLCLLVVLLAIRVWDPLPLELLRLRVFDLYQIIEPRKPSPQPVVIVDIDEESLAEIGQWPWPRTDVARMVDNLRAAGAVAIGFDVVFAEPDRTSPGLYADFLGAADPAVLGALKSLPSNDEIFARSLRQARVVLGQSVYHREVDRGEERSPPKIPIATIGGDPRPYMFRFPALVRNTPQLEEAAVSHAIFNLVPGRDGLVRRVPTFVLAEGEIVPALTLELLRIATGGAAFAIKTDDAGIRAVVVGGVEVPTDQNGRLWMYYSDLRQDLYVSAKDLLRGTLPAEKFAGKLVLVGTSAAGLFDIKSTPLRDQIPGVEIHAQMLEMILTGDLLLRPNYALGAELFLLVTVGLLMIALVPVLGAALTMLLGAIVAAVLLNVSWILFTSEGLLIDVAFPLFGSFAVFALLVFTNYLREESRRQEVRSAFHHYLSPTLVDQLANNPDRLVLGGETREMTVLFSDVRGFTEIAERMQDRPQELTHLMNRLLTPLTAEVMDHKGTIDKYMGDAVMAFWNAPLSDIDHAMNACNAALGMLMAVERLNGSLAREAEGDEATVQRLEVGIGVNTGVCVVGNMGSEQRFDYSVLGDAVNLASRLEGQCKTYGAGIILGETTASALGQRAAYVELDLIRVKGKREPQRIFALLGGSELLEQDAARRSIAGIWDLLTAYRCQDWHAASLVIDQLVERQLPLIDLGILASLYRRRVEDFSQNPPPHDWDGVYTALSK